MTQHEDQSKPKQQTAWTDIANLKNDSFDVNLRFRVVKKGITRRVCSKTSGRQFDVADCVIADTSAKISFTLWNEDIDLIEEDKCYYILHGYINVYDECMIVMKGRDSLVKEIDSVIEQLALDIDMSRPFMGKPRRRKNRPTTGRTLNGTTGREIARYSPRKSF